MESTLTRFSIACAVGETRIQALVVLDKKNRSIHLHLHCEDFPKGRMPIAVKRLNHEFPRSGEADLIQEIIREQFPNETVKIEGVSKLESGKEPPAMAGTPKRIILRFR